MTVTTADPHSLTNPPNLDDTVTGTGAVLDGSILNASVTITVTAVPEPGSLGLGGLAALSLAVGLWRRWRQPRVAA